MRGCRHVKSNALATHAYSTSIPPCARTLPTRSGIGRTGPLEIGA